MKAKELLVLLSKINPDAEICYTPRFGDPPRKIIDAVTTLDSATIYLIAQVPKAGRQRSK